MLIKSTSFFYHSFITPSGTYAIIFLYLASVKRKSNKRFINNVQVIYIFIFTLHFGIIFIAIL
ncbi:MAG: hypothetical protein A2Y23_09645 [Clostridiales bacterium GWB2_37_7]|nr:MAG: hypothetical protein A2Y23_09645 [Clostridiales bacterium GWB2_37_7]